MRSFLPLLCVLGACAGKVDDPAADDTAMAEDTAAEDTATDDTDTDDTAVAEVDDDGDGFPAWRTTDAPLRADCDDADAAVTPDTERLVPAGSFTRGQADLPWASPVRTITLSAYCIDRTEVTNVAFVALLQAEEAAGRSNVDEEGRPLYNLEDLENGDTFPARIEYADGAWGVVDGYADHAVVEVYHWSALRYCASVGKALPTEAQWEKAARGAEDARMWPWGDEPPGCEHANFVLTEAGEPPQDGEPCVQDTTPVGAYPRGASAGGALDLAGNVSEWVADWFDPEAYADDPDVDPTGPEEGALFHDGVGEFVTRIARGGGFLHDATGIQVAFRTPEPEGGSSNGVGFRCARPLE